MVSNRALKRPIRVVMFGSGPELNPDAKEFLCRLEEHPEIEFLGAFCQADSQSLGAVFRDLWKRRGVLAVPLLALRWFNNVLRFMQNPRAGVSLAKRLDHISRRIYFVKDIHDPEVLRHISLLRADLGLVYGSPILRPQLFDIPRLGTLGIHHGKVPEYRGNKTAFWMMYNGEPCVGVTIQKINQGLDTGSIVKTGEVSAVRRTYPAVVRELEELGLDLYIQAVLEMKNGTAQFRPQTGVKGKLYRNPKPVDLLRFWGRQVQRRLKAGQ